LWKQTKESKVSTVDSPQTGRCGRKKKMCSPNLETLPNVPFSGRGTTHRNLSCAIDVPRRTLHGILKRGDVFRRISSAAKQLTYIERDKSKPRLKTKKWKQKLLRMEGVYQTCTRTVEVIIAVETAFNQLGHEKLSNIFVVDARSVVEAIVIKLSTWIKGNI
jgi:hypothetical protein